MEASSASKITRKGLVLVAIAALMVSAVGLGVAQGGKKGAALTKKSAKKTYLSKKTANKQFLTKSSADSQFQKLQKSLQIPASMAAVDPADADVEYEDTNGFAGGARHLNQGFGNIGWSFILPPHYPGGTALNVKIYHVLNVSGCSFNLEPNSLSLNNLGSNSVGDQNDIGNPADILTAPPSNQVGSVDWTIPATVDGVTLQPGTAVTFGTFRNSTVGGDTCASPVVIKGHEVTWG